MFCFMPGHVTNYGIGVTCEEWQRLFQPWPPSVQLVQQGLALVCVYSPPLPSRVDGFEFTPEIGLFDLMGVSLYHGWLADPEQRETHQVVSQTNYNQLVSMAIGEAQAETQDGDSSEYQAKGESPPLPRHSPTPLPLPCHSPHWHIIWSYPLHGWSRPLVMVARGFLESTAAQMTHHGLSVLVATVREGDYVVVFRNNHFCMCHKREVCVCVCVCMCVCLCVRVLCVCVRVLCVCAPFSCFLVFTTFSMKW